jgi:hypothetical protein
MAMGIVDLHEHEGTVSADQALACLARMREGFDGWLGEAKQMRTGRILFTSLTTEACLAVAARQRETEAGRLAEEQAKKNIDEMLKLAFERNELDRYYVSEVYRLLADLLELQGQHAKASNARSEAVLRARLVERADGGGPLLLEARAEAQELARRAA